MLYCQSRRNVSMYCITGTFIPLFHHQHFLEEISIRSSPGLLGSWNRIFYFIINTTIVKRCMINVVLTLTTIHLENCRCFCKNSQVSILLFQCNASLNNTFQSVSGYTSLICLPQPGPTLPSHKFTSLKSAPWWTVESQSRILQWRLSRCKKACNTTHLCYICAIWA